MLAGVAIISCVVALRCLSTFDPFPYWSGDPFESPAPVVGLTPATSVMLDMVTALGAAVACSAMRAGELRRSAWGLAAAALALFVVLRHMGGATGLDNFVYGLMQVSGFVGAATVFGVAGRPRVRRLVLAALMGLLGVLIVRALQQVYIEHPRTLENFRATREQFFRSQGWTPDSGMAKAFERRLSQPEASGYFGMANALATLGAAGMMVGAGLFRASRNEQRDQRPRRSFMGLPSLVLIVLSGALVYYAGAKGGLAAAGLGVFAVLIAFALQKRAVSVPTTVARLIGPAAVLATLGAVVVRGMIGTRIGELSVLFRWFYMQAAARIIGEHPLMGVGPMGFKGAYLLAKNPLSPEEVTSPHSVLLDLMAGLGIGGVALAVVWMFWTSLGAIGLVRTRNGVDGAGPPLPSDPQDWKLVALVLTLATIAAIGLERAELTPDGALARLAGLGLGLWVATGVVKVLQSAGTGVPARMVRIGVGAGVVACAAHCQIELTSVTPGAAAWCLLLLAVAAGWEGPAPETTDPTASGMKRASVALAVIAVFVGAAVRPARQVVQWQTALAGAYQGTEEVAEVSARCNALAAGGAVPGFEHDSPTALAKDLGAMTGGAVSATPEGIDRAVATIRLADSTRALVAMPTSAGLGHFPTLRARTRLILIQAEAHAGLGSVDRARSAVLAGRAELDAAQPDLSASANYWAWIGTYEEAAGELEDRFAGQPDSVESRAHRTAALAAWGRAHELGPYELLPARKAMTIAESLREVEAARGWAGHCLAINDLLILDPLEQLSAAEVQRCKSMQGK